MKSINVSKLGGPLIMGLLGGVIAFGLVSVFQPNETQIIIKDDDSDSNEVTEIVNSRETQFANYFDLLPQTEVDFTGAAEKTVNSVVHIQTIYTSSYSGDPLLDYFWGRGRSGGAQPKSQKASGSGVIISDDGYIVTNNHVIEDADNIEITLNDGRIVPATLVGTDPSTDLALIKIEQVDLPYASFGNSDDLKIGEWVLAVGNPFNLTSTVTAGIVSAKARSINLLKSNYQKEVFPIESFIQTDAAVNPGNSGGALVTPDGKLIGINTAIASQTGSYSGYSFAVPSNIVKKVTEDLLKYGVVQRAFVGVGLVDITQQIAEEKNLPNLEGVMVTSISPGGAAEEAGINKFDVILKVGDAAVNKVPELQEQIGRFRPGNEVSLTVRKDNVVKTIQLILKNIDGTTSVVEKEIISNTIALGASFQTLSPTQLKSLQIEHGVEVSSLGSGKLRSVGITEGFIITHLDKKTVSSAEEVVQFFASKKGGVGVLVEGVYPNGMKGYFGFGV